MLSPDFELTKEDSENFIIKKYNSDIDNFSITFSIKSDINNDRISNVYQKTFHFFSSLVTDQDYSLDNYYSIILVSNILKNEDYFIEIDYIETENSNILYLDAYCYNIKNQLISKAGSFLKIKYE